MSFNVRSTLCVTFNTLVQVTKQTDSRSSSSSSSSSSDSSRSSISSGSSSSNPIHLNFVCLFVWV